MPAILALAGVLALANDARAQSAGFAVDRFEPADSGSDWFVVDSLDMRGKLRPSAGIVLDWAYKPLALFEPGLSGPPRANVITDQLVTHVSAGLIVWDRLRVSATVPIALYQNGDDIAALAVAARAPAERMSLGDMSFAVDVAAFGRYGDPLRGAVGARVFVPTGTRAQYSSDGTLRATPRAMIAGDFAFFAYGAQLGFAIRPFEGTYEGRPLGHELTFAVAAGMKINDRFVFGPELHGATEIAHHEALRTRATPVDLLVGMHVRITDDIQVGSAIGPGLTRGDGSPSMRVLVSLELIPDVCVDKDGDGICKGEDACPDEAGPRTQNRRTNGCPALRPAETDSTPTPEQESR